MPYHVDRHADCPDSKPWTVLKDDGAKADGAACHESKEKAVKQMQAMMASEGMLHSHDGDHETRAAVDNSEWDGNAAMTACKTAADYRAICAGRKSGPAEERGSWALPHHKRPGSPPNADGVRNSLSRLPQTEGLVNKEEAQRHLDRHMSTIQAQAAAASPAELRQQRHGTIPADTARRLAFPTQFHSERVTLEGLEFVHLRGIATVYERPYEMWDAFGTYNEVVNLGAGAVSLAKKPNVMFLLNHAGSPMARTVNEKRPMDLREEPDGLHVQAWVNPNRGDVRDMVIGIDDGDITDMSFAFMITKGAWNDDYTEFRIQEYDIDGGDVSVVAKGANPYTSVGARAQEIMADLDFLPVGAQRAAFMRLQQHLPDLDQRDRQGPPVKEPPTVQPSAAQPTGASVNLIRARLALMDNSRP